MSYAPRLQSFLQNHCPRYSQAQGAACEFCGHFRRTGCLHPKHPRNVSDEQRAETQDGIMDALADLADEAREQD